jgi:DNA primase
MILEEGMNVRVVLFPDGEDPDSFAKSHRTSELEEYIEGEAKDFILFKAEVLQKDAGNDPIRRSSLIRDIVTSVSLIPDGITRSVYVKECSTLLDVPEQTLVNEINKIYRKKFSSKYNNYVPDPVVKPKTGLLKKEGEEISKSEAQERDVIRLMLQFPENEIEVPVEDSEEMEVIDVASFILTEIAEDDLKFDHPVYQAIYNLVLERLEHGEFTTQQYLVNHSDPAISQSVIDIMATPYSLSENWEKNKIYVKREENLLQRAVLHSMLAFKSRKVDQELSRLLKEVKEMTEEAEVISMIERIKALQAIQRKINGDMGRTIVG